jgi:galactose mutarotase-like enzyme
MNNGQFVTLTSSDGSMARVAPHLGGWLLRYARPIEGRGLVDALHCTQAVIDRYPREMYAGNPILFPLVSFNHLPGREHHYVWKGQTYPMPQHGFGRRLPWSVVDQNESSLTLELNDSDATRPSYPFSFRQRLTYRLAEGRLHWEQVIENRSAEPLPFSTGFHPYFAVPLTEEGQRPACYVEIPECTEVVSQDQARAFSEKPFPAQNLNVQTDVSGTLFLTRFRKRELAIVDPLSELEVLFNFEEAPQHRFVALWSRTSQEPYYCIEPWTSLPNSFLRTEKSDLIVLLPQNTFRAAFWIELRKMS